jgi:gamma-glutamylcyclotransferase (GGCT)/AIG2-like uncharacterized protein YtfP
MPLMFLNGGGMRGGPLHHLLDGAPLVAAAMTAPRYRLYSVADRFPALLPVAHGGAEIVGEVYDVAMVVLRDRLLPAEPLELELGVIELIDGTSCLAMLLRRPPTSFAELFDITEHGGWAAYRSSS